MFVSVLISICETTTSVCQHASTLPHSYEGRSRLARWQIDYDDGTWEDYDSKEMFKYCISLDDGDVVDATPMLEDKRDAASPAGCLCGCDTDVILTQSNETFPDLCIRLKLTAEQLPIYYESITL